MKEIWDTIARKIPNLDMRIEMLIFHKFKRLVLKIWSLYARGQPEIMNYNTSDD